MVKNNKKVLVSSIIVLSIFLIDQLTKYFVRIKNPHVDFGLIKILFVKNTGSSFGLFQGQNIFLIIFGIIFLALFFYFIKDILIQKDYYAYFFIIGGAIGNLFDRLFFGFVTDMISIMSFPVFNIADSFITIGAIIILIYAIKEEVDKKRIK